MRSPSDRRRRSGARGQSLAEIAIALPILLVLLIGLVEMARAWNVRQVMTNAAREGARQAVVVSGWTEADVIATTESYLADANLDASLWSVTVSGMGGSVGTPTTVTVTYNYSFVVLGPVVDLLEAGATIPGTITMTTQSTMRNE